jgi:hypothetical protein
MIEAISETPCWWVDEQNPDLDQIHYSDRAAAEDAAGEARAEAGAVRARRIEVRQLDKCCFIARCDLCGHLEADAEGHTEHIPASSPEHVASVLNDLTVTLDGRLACYECLPAAIRDQLEDWFLHDAPRDATAGDLARALAPVLVTWRNQ